MYIRTLYLTCFGYRRAVTNGTAFSEWWFIEPPEYFSATAAAVRAAFRGQVAGPARTRPQPGGSGDSAPVEVPEDIVERVRALCLALPEVTVRIDESLVSTRSTAWSFDIRHRSFCLLVARANRAGQPVPLLVLRASPEDREALLAIGRPFFPSRSGGDRIAVLLTGTTDWAEIRELVTESYRILAPKKLTG